MSKRVEEIAERQKSYELKCEEDRKELRRNDIDLTKKIEEVAEAVSNHTKMMKPFIDMFRGFAANPKVQSAMIGIILAAAAYITYHLHNLSNPSEPRNQQPIIVLQPTQQPNTDAGKQ